MARSRIEAIIAGFGTTLLLLALDIDPFLVVSLALYLPYRQMIVRDRFRDRLRSTSLLNGDCFQRRVIRLRSGDGGYLQYECREYADPQFGFCFKHDAVGTLKEMGPRGFRGP
jgi:hypothetical protein